MKRSKGPRPIANAQFELLDELSKGNALLRAFLVLIYQRMKNKLWINSGIDGDYFAEIPYQTRRRLFPGLRWEFYSDRAGRYKEWRKRSKEIDSAFVLGTPIPICRIDGRNGPLILTRNHSAEENRCRGYRLPVWLVAELDALAPVSLLEAEFAEYRNPFNGRRAQLPLRSIRSRSNHRCAPLIVGALDSLEYGLFDAAAVESCIAQLQASRLLETRYRRAKTCYEHVLIQRPWTINGLSWYRLAYTVSSTGRIYQRGGALQNCPREMKSAAYSGVPNANNYDIRRSHLTGLVLLAESEGLPVPATRALINGPTDLGKIEKSCGLREGTLKTVVYAVLNGARFPFSFDICPQGGKYKHSVRDAIRDNALRDQDDGHELIPFRERYVRTRESLDAFLSEVKAWHEALMDFVYAHATDGRGGQYIRNAVGMNRLVGPIKRYNLSKKVVARRVAPHLLQGLEAAFIHALTIRLHAQGIQVISNEHDGLVVLGEVFAEDVEEACIASGFVSAVLQKKPFC